MVRWEETPQQIGFMLKFLFHLLAIGNFIAGYVCSVLQVPFDFHVDVAVVLWMGRCTTNVGFFFICLVIYLFICHTSIWLGVAYTKSNVRVLKLRCVVLVSLICGDITSQACKHIVARYVNKLLVDHFGSDQLVHGSCIMIIYCWIYYRSCPTPMPTNQL